LSSIRKSKFINDVESTDTASRIHKYFLSCHAFIPYQPTMTRKHFELIAKALADLRNETYHEMADDDHLRNRLVYHI
jgi:hypothetical protein